MKSKDVFSEYVFLNEDFFKQYFSQDVYSNIKKSLIDLDLFFYKVLSSSKVNEKVRKMYNPGFFQSGKKLRSILMFFVSEIWKKKKKLLSNYNISSCNRVIAYGYISP